MERAFPACSIPAHKTEKRSAGLHLNKIGPTPFSVAGRNPTLKCAFFVAVILLMKETCSTTLPEVRVVSVKAHVRFQLCSERRAYTTLREARVRGPNVDDLRNVRPLHSDASGNPASLASSAPLLRRAAVTKVTRFRTVTLTRRFHHSN